MKPIKLKIKGLNSYNEEQVIDFARLLEGGVFGIFGPTGSGKSTILDGITIALYGYKAIPRDTKDFINTDSEKAYIYFEFELIADNGRSNFIVERSIKRNKTGGITTDFVRLTESNQGNVVVEDKVGEINKRITDVLGLNAQDFLRSVVLPQGKFSDFLKLKNKERCDMLERILGLQEYGERLTKKVTSSKKRVEIELSSKQGEIRRYEGVSKDILEELKKSLDELLIRIANINNEIIDNKKALDENKIIVSLQDELERFKKEKSELERRDEHIQSMGKSIEKYEKAIVIKPILDEINSNKEKMLSNGKDLAINEEKLRIEKEKLAKYDEEFKLIDKKYVEDLPLLNRLQIKLEELLKVDGELSQIEQERNKLAEEYRNKTASIKEIERTLKQNKNNEKILKDNIESSSKELDEIYIDNEYKTSVININNDVKRLMELDSKLIEIDKRINTLKDGIDRDDKSHKVQNEQLKKLKMEIEDLEERLEDKQGLYNENISMLNGVKEGSHRLETKIKEVEKNLSKVNEYRTMLTSNKKSQKEILLKREYNVTKEKQNKDRLEATIKELKQLEISQRAGVLAIELKDDKECPVCGSTNHPKLATSVDRTEIRKLQTLRDGYDEDRREIQKSTFELDAQMEIVKSKINDSLRILDELEPLVEGIDIEILKQEYKSGLDKAKKLADMIKEQEVQIPELKKLLKSMKENRELYDRDSKNISIRLESNKVQLTNKGQERATLNTDMESLKSGIDTKASELNIEDIAKELEQISIKDKRYKVLKVQLEDTRKKLEAIRKDISISESDISKLVSDRNVAEELGKSKAEIIKAKKQIIQSVTEGRELKAYLEETIKGIDEIKNSHSTIIESITKSKDDITTIDNIVKDLFTRNKLLSSIVDKKEKELREIALKLNVSDYVAVTTDVPDESVVNNFKQSINTHKEKHGINKSNIERVTALIDGRSCSKEKFEVILAKQNTLREENSKLLSDKGKLNESISTMESSLKVLEELKKEESKLDSKLGMLKELLDLIRGKKFVEFIAISRLKYISREASNRLMSITNNRFSLELDSKGGFIICDNYNGGVRRDSNSLSGGETFLTSLALALSLSSHIQLKGTSSIEFFFMDEGFGTLDNQLLDMVMSSLEKLREENLSVGIISHVKEIKDRVPVKLIVDPAEAGVCGTKVCIEH